MVVHRLGPADILAFGMASRYCAHVARAARGAILTKGSIRWIVTQSGFDEAVSSINACAASFRPNLVRALMRQIWTLHPTLQPNATLSLQRLLPPPSPRAQLRDRLDRHEHGMAPGIPLGTTARELPALASIMALPWQVQGKLLLRWLDLADGAAPDNPSLAAWRATISSLPPSHGIDILIAVVATACDDDDGWPALLDYAYGTAVAMLDNRAPLQEPQSCTRLLLALAHAIRSQSVRDEDVSPVRTTIWDKLLSLAGRLPADARLALLTELAAYLSLAAYARHRDSGLVHRCERLIDAAFQQLRPADTARALCAIAADPYRDENDRRGERLPILTTVLLAATRLPADGYADVLVAVLAGATSYWDSQHHSLIWDAISVASTLTTPVAGAKVLTALAAAIDWTIPQDQDNDDAAVQRWSSIAQRVARLPALLRGEALVALCSSMSCMRSGVQPVNLLLELASDVPVAYRAELLARLIHHPNYIKDPAQWRDIMHQVAALPVQARAITARKLILALAYFGNEVDQGGHAPADTPPDAAAPAESAESAEASMSARPISPADARHKLSLQFAGLTEHDRARLLAQFAGKLHRRPWHAPAIEWLLRETMRLPVPGRHEPYIITATCAFAAQACPPEQADTVHGWLVDAIAARLPAQHRGAALLYLSDLNSRVGASPGHLGAIDALREGVPEHDRQAAAPHAASSRKRKDRTA